MKLHFNRSKAACSITLAALMCWPAGVSAFGVEGQQASNESSPKQANDIVAVEPDWDSWANGAGQSGKVGVDAKDAGTSASDASAQAPKVEAEADEPADDRETPGKERQEADAQACLLRILLCDQALGRAEGEVSSMTESLVSFTEAVKAFGISYEEIEKSLEPQQEGEVIAVETIDATKLAQLGKTDSNKSGIVKEKLPRLMTAADRAGDVALAIEASCARVREHDLAASDAFLDLYSTRADVFDARARMMEAWLDHDKARSSAQSACGYWYNLVDAVAGYQGSFTFGTGLEFSLSEEEFVSKWGAAIDKFYDQQSEELDRDIPLAGYGEAMARKAYELRMDPRLCAAVSMTETAGGSNCAYENNAWNFKDFGEDGSYDMATWDSFDKAIGEWCEGLLDSKIQYSKTSCLSAFGDMYSTDSKWTVRTAEYMQAISDLTR